MNINFVSDYVRDNGDGTTTTFTFNTPVNLQSEFGLLEIVREKMDMEEGVARRSTIGFRWNPNNVISLKNSSVTAAANVINQ